MTAVRPFPRLPGLAAKATAAACAALLLAAAAPAPEAGVTLAHPWMRTLIPGRPAAGYFTLHNTTATAKTLVAARSPACGTLMLHESLHKGGVDRMVMVHTVPLPANGALSFAPGGYHLMCMKPDAAVHVGASVPVTLVFGDGGTLAAEFPVRGATAQ